MLMDHISLKFIALSTLSFGWTFAGCSNETESQRTYSSTQAESSQTLESPEQTADAQRDQLDSAGPFGEPIIGRTPVDSPKDVNKIARISWDLSPGAAKYKIYAYAPGGEPTMVGEIDAENAPDAPAPSFEFDLSSSEAAAFSGDTCFHVVAENEFGSSTPSNQECVAL